MLPRRMRAAGLQADQGRDGIPSPVSKGEGWEWAGPTSRDRAVCTSDLQIHRCFLVTFWRFCSL